MQPQRPPRLASLNKRKRPANPKPDGGKKTVQCTNVNCLSFNIIEEHGQQLCQECGAVYQEVEIVNDNAFGEGRDGQLTMIGSQVSNDKTRGRPFGSGAIKGAGAFESREIAERNGDADDKHFGDLGFLANVAVGVLAMSKIASALNMSQSLRAPALQIYRMAMNNNFIQGRSIERVAAIVVFDLGHVYRDLVDRLNLEQLGWRVLPINPENLIQRFAEMLEFEPHTQQVASDAVRIVARMDRDWMTVGRRPAGVCGAALLLAARMNDFRKTVREVVHVVRVAEVTVNKRLDEFKFTASSNLTVEQFRTTDLEVASDPPSFYEKKGPKKRRGRPSKTSLVQQDEEEHHQLKQDAPVTPANANRQLQTPANTQHQALADSQSMPPPSRPIAIDPALLQASAQGLAELESASDHDSPSRPARKNRRITADSRKIAQRREFEEEQKARIRHDIEVALPNVTKAFKEVTGQANPSVSSPEPPTPEQSQISPDDPHSSKATGTGAVQSAQDEDSIFDESDREVETPPVNPKRTPREPPPPRPVQLITATSTSQSLLDRVPSSPLISDTEFGSDPELDDCLLTAAEHDVKKRIWTQENKDYLRAQQTKQLKQKLAEENGTARQVKRRKRRRTRMGDMSAYEEAEEGPPKDAADAVQRMMKKRGFSKKINYAMLDSIYTPSSAVSGAATPSESIMGMGMGMSRAGSVIEGDGKGEADEKGKLEVKVVEPKTDDVGTKRKREEEEDAVVVEDEGAATGAGANAEEPIELSDAEEESDGEDYFPVRDERESWKLGLNGSVPMGLDDHDDHEYDEDD
ncbi:MAG: hypothetical protein Q9167_002250 [Letrouitia subvulpina]